MNLTCMFRWGKAHERCLEEQRLRQEQRQENREDRQENRQENREDRQENRQDGRLARQNQRQGHNRELAAMGALPGQILNDAHSSSNQSANEFWSGWFGGGNDAPPVYIPPPGAAPAPAPTAPAPDNTPVYVAAGVVITVALAAIGAAVAWR